MVEGIFQNFIGTEGVICPSWRFSCNAMGDALLDVYEIICPLDLTSGGLEYVQDLKSEVSVGVGAIIDSQVVINTNATTTTLIILMYSQDEVDNAMDWLLENVTDDLPPEIIIDGCRLNGELLVTPSPIVHTASPTAITIPPSTGPTKMPSSSPSEMPSSSPSKMPSSSPSELPSISPSEMPSRSPMDINDESKAVGGIMMTWFVAIAILYVIN